MFEIVLYILREYIKHYAIMRTLKIMILSDLSTAIEVDLYTERNLIAHIQVLRIMSTLYIHGYC